MLTHAGASLEEIEPYAASVLYPLRPLCLYGRWAGAAGAECRQEDAVYYAWRDSL